MLHRDSTPRPWRREPVAAALAALVACLVLSACGSGSSAGPNSGGSGGGTATAGAEGAGGVATTAPLNWAAQSTATLTDQASGISLSVQLVGSTGVAAGDLTTPVLYQGLGIACAPRFILAASATGAAPAPISATDLKTLRSYLAGLQSAAGPIPAPDQRAPAALGSWVAGGNACLGALSITNQGSEAVVVQQLGIKLVSAPSANPLTYDELEVCSVLPDGGSPLPPDWVNEACLGGQSGGGPDSAAGAQILLGAVTSGQVYSAQVCTPRCDLGQTQGMTPTPGLSVGQAGSSAQTQLAEYDLVGPSDGQGHIVKVVPELTVQNAATHATKTFVMQNFASTLVFAADSQLRCYGLDTAASAADGATPWQVVPLPAPPNTDCL